MPPTATLGITELGVMGYYAQRPTIDFLGLTSPQYRNDIRRGDTLPALIREQPDVLALTAVNALYDISPQREDWFTLLYTSVQRFDDARFWGGPITVYQRMRAPMTSTRVLDDRTHALGDGWQVLQVDAHSKTVRPGEPVLLRVLLQAGTPMGTRNLRVQPEWADGGDGLPVAGRVIRTDLWRPGETAWVDVPIAPQPSPRPGAYRVVIGWDVPGAARVVAGHLRVPLPLLATSRTVADLSEGVGTALLGEIDACAARDVAVPLLWRTADLGTRNLTAFVHVRDGARTVAQTDDPPRGGRFPTSAWGDGELLTDARTLRAPAQPGVYPIVVGLYDRETDLRLAVAPGPHANGPDEVRVGTLVVKPCA
jgi:hypothetical protein